MNRFRAWMLVCCVILMPRMVYGQEGPLEVPPSLLKVLEEPVGNLPVAEDGNCINLLDKDPFRKCCTSVSFMSGHYSRTSTTTKGASPVSYSPQMLRVGVMLCDPILEDSWLRGNWEMITDLLLASVSKDVGSYILGQSVLLRGNFLKEDCAVIPYFQVGAGIVNNDLHPIGARNLVGKDIELMLRAEAGLRFMVTENLSIDLEFGYQAISHPNVDARGQALKSVGAAIGFTYGFGK